MKTEGVIFGGVSVFLGGSSIVYWQLSRDWTGTTALALSFGLAFLIGFYILFTGRRIDVRPEDRPDADISDGAGEIGFFSPHSWWPLIAGVGAMLCALGIVFGWWLFLLGVAVAMPGAWGLLSEYDRENRNLVDRPHPGHATTPSTSPAGGRPQH